MYLRVESFGNKVSPKTVLKVPAINRIELEYFAMSIEWRREYARRLGAGAFFHLR
jgi:hypothetical protein